MIDRWLVRHLVVPLSLASACFLALHMVLPLGGLFLNLAASFVAIVVTVLYVDRILQRHERLRWEGAATLISGRILATVTGNITNLRVALDFPSIEPRTLDSISIHGQYLAYCEQVIEPAVHSRVKKLDVAGWKKLARAIQTSYANCENVLTLFSNRLDPKQLQHLVELENALRTAMLPYETFPDLLGVPDHELPLSKSDPRSLRNHQTEWGASEVERALRTCRLLGQYELSASRQ